MIEVIKLEGKSQEELLSQIKTEDVHYKVEEIPGKLFKGKKYELTYVKKEEIKNFIKNYISNIASSMNTTINVEIRESEENYNVMLISENNPILIGKDGKTLNSIQLLIHQAINNVSGFNIRVNIDVAGYKANREKRLESQVKRIAKEVLNTKIEAKLDPMNSYDRRLVHNVVGKFKNLESLSYGEEPLRYIVISYKED